MDDPIRLRPAKPFRMRPTRTGGDERYWVLEVNGTEEVVACGWTIPECLKIVTAPPGPGEMLPALRKAKPKTAPTTHPSMDDQIRPKREKPFRLRPARNTSGERIWLLEVNGTKELVTFGSVSQCLEAVRGLGVIHAIAHPVCCA
jgi:hypothetical protein